MEDVLRLFIEGISVLFMIALMERPQFQIPLNHADCGVPSMAALGKIALLPEFSKPPVLVRRRASVLVFHFNPESVVLSACNRQVQIRHTPPHT
jgi:hypothetical protein